MKQNYSIFIFSLFAYAVALVGQVWFIFYLTPMELWRNIYASQQVSTPVALMIDAGLVSLFGLQHSLMARASIKRYLSRFVPQEAQRSVYVLLSGVALIVVCAFWQPIDGTLWRVENKMLETVLWGGFVFGWIFSLIATFVIDHFELFGLKQGWYALQGKTLPDTPFGERWLYRYVRHPIQLGVLIGLWITPHMTVGHMLFSLFFTLYIFIGLYFEEKDLMREFGDIYREYKRRVGMLWPRFRR